MTYDSNLAFHTAALATPSEAHGCPHVKSFGMSSTNKTIVRIVDDAVSLLNAATLPL